MIQEEILHNFKKLWYNDYLLSLREHSRNLFQSSWDNKIKIGDVVLIKASNKPRPYWMMGRVLELIQNQDHRVRTVRLKQGNGAIEYHSISNLYPLEVSVTHAGGVAAEPRADRGNGNDVSAGATNASSRPPRRAAGKCQALLRQKLPYL